MKRTRKFAIMIIGLMVAFAMWSCFWRGPLHPSVTVPGGVVFRYEETTQGKSPRPSANFPAIYSHSRWTQPDPIWKLFDQLPTFLKFGKKAPAPQCLGSISESTSDQAIWFSMEGKPKKDLFWQVLLEDENGYSSQSNWIDYGQYVSGQHLIVPGMGPRRSKWITVHFVNEDWEHPAAKMTIRNPLKPTGPPFAEIDRLPASRTFGDYTVTLKSVIREKLVTNMPANKSGSGLRIAWEITKNGVVRPEWRLEEGTLADGGGNFSLMVQLDQAQEAICTSALFSDDPVWKIKLVFRRSDKNISDYYPLMHIPDLPLPESETSVSLNKSYSFPPYEVTIGEISRFYSAAWQSNQVRVSVRSPNFGLKDYLRVLRSDLRYCTNSGMGGGPVDGEFIFDDPKSTHHPKGTSKSPNTWSLDLGADKALEPEFQCRVHFAP